MRPAAVNALARLLTALVADDSDIVIDFATRRVVFDHSQSEPLDLRRDGGRENRYDGHDYRATSLVAIVDELLRQAETKRQRH